MQSSSRGACLCVCVCLCGCGCVAVYHNLVLTTCAWVCSNYQRMRAARARLPAAKFEERIISLTAGNRAILVSGATGCGKTTQVPQFILDDLIRSGEGGAAHIVCTQVN